MWKSGILVMVILHIHAMLPNMLHAGSDLNVSGYARNFLVLTESQSISSVDALIRARVKVIVRSSETVTWEFAYEAVPWISDQKGILSEGSFFNGSLLTYRIDDLDENILDDSDRDFILGQNLDRAFLTYTSACCDLFAGRQPVAFGSARVINPTDVIAPFAVNTIAKDELVGVDAIRLKTPLSQMGEFDVGLVFGRDFSAEQSAAFIRMKSYVMNTDISVMTMVFKENILLGLDLVRSIGGAGTWIEAAHVLADAADDYSPEENYSRLSAGADYSFTSRLYAFIEYHYNGAGRDSPSDYLTSASETAYTEGAVNLLARHYISPGLTFEISPLIVFASQVLLNLNDGSALVSPSVEWSVGQNTYAGLSAFIGIGPETASPVKPENEFGLYADTYFGSLSFYF